MGVGGLQFVVRVFHLLRVGLGAMSVRSKYGVNCKAAKPDVTAPNCAKTYNVDFECAPGQARGAGAPAEASGKTVQLACN